MMECTDRHCRYFLRVITKHTLLYTEMITAAAILNGSRDRLLAFDPAEHPVGLQVGGSDPDALASCARIADGLGYDEINLNVGCPSDRVQSGRFGACLMAEPELVADCVSAMRAATSLPVTVKTRIGVDERDTYQDLTDFVATVERAGCQTFIVHARKAWLKGLSPKENREVPPLRYDVVLRLKEDFPHLEIVLNGGIDSLDDVVRYLEVVDGVMIGREAYHNPYLLALADQRIFGDNRPAASREDIVSAFLPYVERELANGTRLAHMSRHMLGLFQAVPGARAWRRALSERANRPDAGTGVVREAMRHVSSTG